MKYLLLFCLVIAFFISPAHCDCVSACLNTYMSAVQGLTAASQICPIMQNYLKCLEQSCKIDLSPYYSYLNNEMKTIGISCDLNAASRSVSLSLLTVCGSALLTAYRIFSM